MAQDRSLLRQRGCQERSVHPHRLTEAACLRTAPPQESNVAHYRTGFLAEADLVDALNAPTVEHRCGADHLCDGDHSGSPTPVSRIARSSRVIEAVGAGGSSAESVEVWRVGVPLRSNMREVRRAKRLVGINSNKRRAVTIDAAGQGWSS